MYHGERGNWGMVSEFLRSADKLQVLGILTNISGIPRVEHEQELIPKYSKLISRLGIRGSRRLVLGSCDSFVDLNPDGARRALAEFLVKNSSGLRISLQPDRLTVDRFVVDGYLTRGVPETRKFPYEPIYIRPRTQSDSALEEFEALIQRDVTEAQIERFLAANYATVFGSKYDRIETQVWLDVPELDIASRQRRTDVFLRNAVTSDWELLELKRPKARLTGTSRDVPSFSRAVHVAIQQLRNYARHLGQQRVRERLAKRGIHYFNPSLQLVIGKTPSIQVEQWRWLMSTCPQDIKLVPYDVLLAEMRYRILDREKSHSTLGATNNTSQRT
jgi:hypothetical protein